MLWAASDVFTAFGFDLANMQTIADSAGVPKQAASQFLLLTVGSIDCNNLMAVNESRISAAVELFVQAYA
jgi:hypothetical protein